MSQTVNELAKTIHEGLEGLQSEILYQRAEVRRLQALLQVERRVRRRILQASEFAHAELERAKALLEACKQAQIVVGAPEEFLAEASEKAIRQALVEWRASERLTRDLTGSLPVRTEYVCRRCELRSTSLIELDLHFLTHELDDSSTAPAPARSEAPDAIADTERLYDSAVSPGEEERLALEAQRKKAAP